MAKSPGTKADMTIELPRLKTELLEVVLIGDAPLICHAWSEKAKAMMLDKQTGRANAGRAKKSPEQDFVDSLYWLSERPTDPSFTVPKNARFGFPSVAFKAAATSACRFVAGAKMTEVRGAFHLLGDMVEIQGTPRSRSDMVRVGMGTADIRFRGEFPEWSAKLLIRYNVNALSAEQIINLLNVGGFGCGVGEWRPEKDGSFGLFHVATDKDIQQAAKKGARK